MDSVHCGQCKFWGKNGETGEFRECIGIVHDKDLLTNNLEDNVNVDDNDDWTPETLKFRSENKAVTIDDSGYFAALRTKEDFGCVLYKKRD